MQHGFTAVETLIVLAIIGIAAAVVMPSVIGARQGANLANAQASVIEILETARNRAMNGVGGANQGVRVEANKVTLFSGSAFSGGTIIREVALPSTVTTQGSLPADIIFTRISGAAIDKTITLKNSVDNKTSLVNVKAQGAIYPN